MSRITAVARRVSRALAELDCHVGGRWLGHAGDPCRWCGHQTVTSLNLNWKWTPIPSLSTAEPWWYSGNANAVHGPVLLKLRRDPYGLDRDTTEMP